MLTDIQLQKAEEILYNRKASYHTIEQKIAYWHHKNALKMVETYNLPYRICLNYIKADNKGYVLLNPNYPMPGYPLKDLIHV